MARIIRLKESDITNIVKKIIREGRPGRPGTGGTPPPHYPEGPTMEQIGRPDDKKWRELGKIFLRDVKTVSDLKSKLTKFYNDSPDWVKETVGMSPAEAFRKLDGEGGGGDDGPQALAWWWIACKVIFYVTVAYQLCCETWCYPC